MNIFDKRRECKYCGRVSVPNIKVKNVIMVNGEVEEIRAERCGWCDNLVYGHSKRVKNGM